MTVIAGVLFLALVYFAVGQAASVRNGAQTAADAAALAAAQDAREQLRRGWLEVIQDPAQWQRFVDGDVYSAASACRSADDFAARNGATVTAGGCRPLRLAFSVTVRTTRSVGSSIVPGTESRHASATATAELRPRCLFDMPEPPPGTEVPEPPPDEETPEPAPDAEETPEPIKGLVCEGEAFEIDPEAPALPAAQDLFDVRLVREDE